MSPQLAVFNRHLDVEQSRVSDFELVEKLDGLLLGDRHHDLDGLVSKLKKLC